MVNIWSYSLILHVVWCGCTPKLYTDPKHLNFQLYILRTHMANDQYGCKDKEQVIGRRGLYNTYIEVL